MASLRDLDECTTQMTRLVHQSTPLPDWQSVRMVIRSNPSGSSTSSRFVYTLADGSVEKGMSPADPAMDALDKLVDRHRRLCSALGQPLWFQLTLNLDRGGRFDLAFEYRDQYEPGDTVRG